MCPRAKTKTKVKSAKWKIKQQQQQQQQKTSKTQKAKTTQKRHPDSKSALKRMRWDEMVWYGGSDRRMRQKLANLTEAGERQMAGSQWLARGWSQKGYGSTGCAIKWRTRTHTQRQTVGTSPSGWREFPISAADACAFGQRRANDF